MGKTFVLKAEIRSHTGSKDAARLREAGRIPAIVYGHKEQPVAISLDARSFVDGLHHGHRLMDVQIGDKQDTMIVKDLQYDHLGKDLVHADLMRVDVTEVVKVAVPVEIKGTAKGTHEGGIVESHQSHIEIECRVTDIPEKIVVSVKDLDVDQSIHARDIVLPEGAKLASSPELLVISCHVVAEIKTVEEVEAETPIAPEVIVKGKEVAEGEEAVEGAPPEQPKEKEKEKK